MRSTRIVAMLSVVAGLALLTAAPQADARMTRTIDADGAKTVPIVFVGTVKGTQKAGVKAMQRQQVEQLDVQVEVKVAIKGVRPGDSLTVRNFHALPSQGIVLNGFMFPELVTGRNYLFMLEKTASGLIQRYATEADIVELSPKQLGTLIKTSKFLKSLGPVAAVRRILLHPVQACAADCHRAIWMLNTPGAKTLKPTDRVVLVKALLAVTKHPKTDDNSKHAAYSFLGTLGETQIIKTIIAVAVGPKPAAKPGVTDWLQGFDEATQRAALQTIERRSPHKDIVESARLKLKHLR